MNHKVIEIKKGIKLHIIKTDKFKTNLLAIFLATPLDKDKITKNALIPAVLRRGSSSMPTQEDISKELEEMYGASFNCGVEKTGDNQIIKFYLESISDDFLPQKEDLLKKSIAKIIEIAFNPLIENGMFKEEYVNSEKENLKQIIEGKKDNKAQYAMDRCVEIMYKDKPYGLYKYGSIEQLDEINAKNLYEQYQDLISNCKIDIFVSGNVDENIREEIEKDIEILGKRETVHVKNTGRCRELLPRNRQILVELNGCGETPPDTASLPCETSYDPERRALTLIPRGDIADGLTLRWNRKPSLPPIDLCYELRKLLFPAGISFDLKQEILSLAESVPPGTVLLAALRRLDLPESLFGAILELCCAE